MAYKIQHCISILFYLGFCNLCLASSTQDTSRRDTTHGRLSANFSINNYSNAYTLLETMLEGKIIKTERKKWVKEIRSTGSNYTDNYKKDRLQIIKSQSN